MDLILYNPKSRNSKGNVQTHRLVLAYKRSNRPFRLKSILKIEDVSQYLRERSAFERIILLGGDGTINQLTNQLIDHPEKPVIHIKKNGSGNDFLRSLRTQDDNPQYIMRNILDDQTSHCFMNGTGIGLDGLVIEYIDKARKKGRLSYFLASFRAMRHFIPEPVDVEIDGVSHHFAKTYTVIVNNGIFVGGGMAMTPDARLDDEQLDVMVVHTIPKAFLFLLFSSVYFGWHTRLTKYVFYTKAKHIKATFTTPQIVQSDGEKHLDVTSIDVQSSGHRIHYKAY
jgi:diacylglycerol kinase family enzyme